MSRGAALGWRQPLLPLGVNWSILVAGPIKGSACQRLSRAARDFQLQAYADSTNKAYKTQRTSYLAFCRVFKYHPTPATSDMLCQYVALLAITHKFKSVKCYMNAVRLIPLEAGLQNPLIGDYHLTCTLQGIRRKLGDRVSRKQPITPCLLLTILSRLDITIQRNAGIWAAALVMFFAMLRRSNVMPPSKEGFSGDKHLRRSDILANRGGVELRVRWSKTNQFRSKVTTYPLPRVKGHPLCPSQAVFHALGCMRGAPRDGPAFVFQEQGELCPLTPDIFIAAIRAALEASVSDVSLYAGHSFRRSGACWAYERGVPIDTIRQIGDWKSDAYTAYIFQDGPALSRAIAPMASELPQV